MTLEYLAFADAPGEPFDDLLGFLRRCTIVAGNGNDAGVFYVDLGVGALSDPFNRATTRTNYRANQFGINAETEQPWCMGRHNVAWFLNCFKHFGKDMKPGRPRLIDRLGNGWHIKTGDLHVHLQGGDPFFGSSNFEIHIAKEIFNSLDIGEDANLLPLLD